MQCGSPKQEHTASSEVYHAICGRNYIWTKMDIIMDIITEMDTKPANQHNYKYS